MIEANESTFDDEINEGLVLVKFGADWCGPCRMLEPHLAKIETNFQGVKIIKVDADESPGLTFRYNVSGLPTVYALKDGEIVDHMVGAAPYQLIANMVEKHL